MFGIVLAVLGTAFGLPEMRDRLHLTLAQEGHIFLLLYLGVFLSNLVVGPLIDSTGHKGVMLFSSLLVGVSLIGLAEAQSFTTAAFVAVILGFAGGGLNTTSNALVSDLYDEQRAAMLNLLGVFFGVGALVVPLVAVTITGRFDPLQLFWIAAALAGAAAVLYGVLKFPPVHEAGGVSMLETFRVLRYPGLLWLGVLLFFEAGNEAAIGGWTSSYAGAAGLSPRTATLVLACYWAAMMFGRVVAARVVNRLGKSRTILLSALVAVLGCGLLLSVQSVGMLALGATVIGLSFAPIFQTTLGMAGDRYEHAGSVFALLFAIALLGAMVAPWIVGQISERYAVHYGMFVPLGGALCICVLAATVMRRQNTVATVTGARDRGR